MHLAHEELEACQKLQELGLYVESSKRLRVYLESHDEPRAAAALGEGLMLQGYWRDALQALEQGLSCCAHHENDQLIQMQIEMQICFLTPIVTGLFTLSLSRADTLYRDFIGRTDIGYLDEHAIKIESYHAKILQLASLYRLLQDSSTIEAAIIRLESLFHKLLSNERYTEAFIMAFDFSKCILIQTVRPEEPPDIRKWQKLFKTLLDRSDVPPLIRAKAIDEIVDITTQLDGNTSNSQLEELSKTLFQQANHSFGALGIRFRQKCRRFQDADADLGQEMETINHYLEEYESLDYISGMHHAIGTLLNSISHLYNFELQLGLVYMCRSLAEKGGGKLLWILRHTGILAQWLTHSGRAARVIEGSEALYQDLGLSDCLWLKGFVAQITAQAYWQIGEQENALHWAELCETAWQSCSATDRAEAATMMLRAKLNLKLDEDNISALVNSTYIHIQDEIKNGLFKSAVEKMDWIITQIFIPKKDDRLITWLDLLENLIPQLSGIDADIKLANLYQARASTNLLSAQSRSDDKFEEKAIQNLEQSIPLYLKHKRLIEAANSRQMHGLLLYSMFKKSPKLQTLQQAFNAFSIASDAFQAVDNSAMICTSSYWCSFIAYEGWRRGWIQGATVLETLVSAEATMDQERIEMSILGGLRAVSRKQSTRATRPVRGLYDMAFHICLQTNLPDLLWEWIQKSKARSLSDSLGVNLKIPQALEREILADTKTREMFEKEAILLADIKKVEPSSRLILRGELFALNKQMQAQPLLKDVLDLRDGRAVKLADIRDLKSLDGTSDQLVFADWFFTNGDCYICSVKRGQTPTISNCNITESSVETWKIKYMDTKEGRLESLRNPDLEEEDVEYPLRQLDCLVAPLLGLISDEDTIVLSVTGALHSIPVHALWIEGKPLIVRNPVIYCASMTTFVQCWNRTVSQNMEVMQKTFMAVYEPSPIVDFNPAEQGRIYKETQGLAVNFKADLVIGQDSSRMKLEEAIQKSSLFHFFGHGIFDKTAIADQALILADGVMSVGEIFCMRLASPHITLIACDSASQSISKGDEPLGIVTALLCAGASSVLGTIWPTASGTGRSLSTHFYTELGKCESETVFDLARALRHAVIQIRGTRRTRQPYHWAPFVLHGAPFMRSS